MSRRARRPLRSGADELKDAIKELEETVEGVVRDARYEASQRTAEGLRRAADRLRDSFRHSGNNDHSGDGLSWDRTRKLYRDSYHGILGGVCAGFAQYYGIKSCTARLVAVIGLLFLGTLTVPAYLIAWAVMERRPRRRTPDHTRAGRQDYRSPAREFEHRVSLQQSLRNIEVGLREVELRLRRAESHVTSDQYALRKELHALDH